jgi:hypothetical protein
VTLGDAESKTATTSWTRFSYTFTTTTAGDYDLSLQNNDNTARTLEFWGAMLNEGATAGDYVKTDASVSGSAPAPAYSGFGDAFGGVTAYYSLRQFTEAETLNAIRVRRSSDDTEQDIGFDANGDLDSTALTTFVNEDVNTYSSDFSSGIDGLIESRVTASSVDGISDGTTSKDDVLQSVLTSGSNTHYIYKNGTFDLSNTYDVSFEYYIPSVRPDGVTPQTIDGIVVRTGTGSDGAYPFSVLDSWESETIQNWSPSTSNLLLFAAAVGEFIGSIDADGDVYYLKNIVVTQTTADGAVTTWYDQTGNGNDATKITESEQPLVVSGGTLVTENGKAAIDFDGVDDEFAISVPITAGFSVFGVYKNTKAGSYLIGNSPELGRRGTNQYRFNDIGFSANGGTHSDSQVLLTGIEDDTNATIYANGTQVAQAVSTFTSATLLQIGKNSPDGTFQEIILFDSDQSSNRGTVTTGGGTLIEGNINTYFDIV